MEVDYQGKRFRLRSEARGTCSQVFQAVGVAFFPTMEPVENSEAMIQIAVIRQMLQRLCGPAKQQER